MSREIKFRAWDNINKKWELGYEYPRLGGFSMKGETMAFGEYSRVLNSFPIEKWDDLILMQYTGLKDKNGTEIYEGDIVHLNHWKSSDLFDYNSPFVVEYYEGEINFKQGDYSNFKGSLNGKIDIEVIGNIYQHSHLLKQITDAEGS